ncbi:undecaprenyldiphospho-muramoylpentapeptide beta-N-acetylglucosaminyltransferase [Arthrobacter sp. MYb229]|uniref:undecaprenyldiphospho-muramoylpentapeptide beta-N-acetylglucosaminyltransferase n=1 Tax=unclassified Arthrobacter TaxID=235627 RepID=UPI000CFE33CE|nr:MULTISPECIES: undecaprenyldiphospho-muramoylpentapeptide beta-N-acetylglucosaminyltransferase [unclassified Arthrobacter]PRA06328.1 undecaprenyldiphospho-muramoylpentapeptide beta-N-acetylglucosaminyltransferase [Arthrobacter sp. MYb229]PRB53230.1 undecaprenyldiphospho-muramoylpentapeptide beta-N-acetylglucosaminyltransferase [Arthrobacter sp. MYb216]
MSDPIRLVVAGGGTAGHISPMLAIADAVRKREHRAEILALGSPGGLETKLVPEAGYRLELIPKAPMPRSISLDLLKFPFRFLKALSQAKRTLRVSGAEALLGVGGYVCTPAYLAAKQLGIPTFVHEANSVAGMANKLGAKHAVAVGTTFANTGLPKERQVGMPMRSNIALMDRNALREEARAYFGLTDEAPVLLVTGGSSGAQSLNTTMVAALDELTAAGIHVVHITGRDKQATDAQGNLLARQGYTQREYVERMDYAYAAADLMICRSGAGTVCELAVAGTPSVLVPLPIGNGEQKLNARALVAAGGAVLVADDEFTPEFVTDTVLNLVTDQHKLEQMSQAAAALGQRDAAEQMAALIIDEVSSRRSASGQKG